uniref:Reverse transcriptase domain-containing protein n=1 Tax=Astyanax mexicanus TaxID=7994 RepID=A0A8B9GWD5_ASTMX
MNAMCRAEQDVIIEAINRVDAQYSISPSSELYKKKLDLQTQYNLVTTTKTERLLLKSRGLVYEHGEKAGHLLAQQLKNRAATQQIPQIRKPNGEVTIDPKEINDTFSAYYSNLYTSEIPSDRTDMDVFLNSLQTPSINEELKNDLDLPLEQTEIINAIHALQKGKAPGPDGYPIEFYQAFSNKLSPILLDMFNDSLSKGVLPPTMTQASICLLLKPGKDKLECNSYRPISLLNSDVKILAKILAIRLETAMHNVISDDQTGFISGRHSFANIRRLLNIIYSPKSRETPEVVVSLDAEKAFDRVEWPYMFSSLAKFGFGPIFISWIKLLYSSPKASIITNGKQSQY